jgi:hypothetical protein
MVYSATLDPGTTSISLQSLLTTFGYAFGDGQSVPRVSIINFQWVDGTIHLTDRAGVAVATVLTTNGGVMLDTTTRTIQFNTPNINGISLAEIYLAGAAATDTVKVFAIQI